MKRESLLAVTRRNEYFPDTMQNWTLFSFANPIPKIKLNNFGRHFDERESNWMQMKSWFSFWRAYFSTHRNISSSAKMNSCKPGTLWMKGHKSLWTLCDSYLKIACGKFLLSEKYVCHILIYSYIRIIILWSSIKDTHVPFLDLHLNMKRRRSAGPGR